MLVLAHETEVEVWFWICELWSVGHKQQPVSNLVLRDSGSRCCASSGLCPIPPVWRGLLSLLEICRTPLVVSRNKALVRCLGLERQEQRFTNRGNQEGTVVRSPARGMSKAL
eukprot:91105-Amphidinium_carterae.1